MAVGRMIDLIVERERERTVGIDVQREDQSGPS